MKSRNFFLITSIIVIGIYVSIWFINYTKAQGFILAGIISLIGLINMLVMRFSIDEYPFIRFGGKQKKIRLKILDFSFLAWLFLFWD